MTAKSSELLSAVAESMQVEADRLSMALIEQLRAEIPELAADQALVDLMIGGVTENVQGALRMLQVGLQKADVVAPQVALETARRMAQRGVPISALLRGYRMGHASFQQAVVARLAEADVPSELLAATTMDVIALSFDYIDRVSEEVVNTYERERDDWVRGRVAARTARVAAILAGKSVDPSEAGRTLGYRLEQTHVGIVVWARDGDPDNYRLPLLERVVHRLAERVGARRAPLVVAVDDAMVWAWLPAPALALESVRATFPAELGEGVSVAAGEPGVGVTGFRRTNRQARQAHAVAAAARVPGGLRMTLSAEVGPVALMCGDLDGTAAWVRGVLDDLALDDEPHARLRETLWAFLSTGGSYTAAAQQLILHKNTVQYRVRKAEEARGRPVQDRRLDLELALLVCRVLGSTVLIPADG